MKFDLSFNYFTLFVYYLTIASGIVIFC